MGVNEGSLQFISYYRYRDDNGKLTYSITIRYILASSACGVCNSYFFICDSMSKK